MSTRLFVGNLPYAATEEDVRQALASPDISIRSVRLAVDRETGRGRGFGFVEVGSPEEAERALQEWNGRMVGGRVIAIDRAHDRKPGGAAPGDRPASSPPRRMGSGGPPPRYAAPPPEPSRPDKSAFVPNIDRDEGEGRRRGKSGGKRRSGREMPKERGGKWRYDPSDDY